MTKLEKHNCLRFKKDRVSRICEDLECLMDEFLGAATNTAAPVIACTNTVGLDLKLFKPLYAHIEELFSLLFCFARDEASSNTRT